jgi:hypothetical protein
MWSVVVTGCHATGRGGGMYFENSAAEMFTSEVYGNSSGGAGGGIACWDSSTVEIKSTRIVGNAGHAAGGFIFAVGSDGLVAGCLVAENTGRWGAGGYISESSPVISECTFARNVCEVGGSALSVVSSSPMIDLTIFAFNHGGTAAPLYCTGSSVAATCIDVYGNDNGDYVDCLSGLLGVDGNISADPMFCDTLSGDYTLHEDSPCLPAIDDDCWRIGAYYAGCYNPTTDFIGVYTTSDGETIDQMEAVLYEEVDIHLMLLSPSDTSGVLVYEFGLTVSPNIDVISFTPSQPGYLMMGEVPGQATIAYPSGSALPSSGDVWLATIRCRLTTADTGYVYIAPTQNCSCDPPAPCYVAEADISEIIPMNISSGSETAPVFRLVPDVSTDAPDTPAASVFTLGQNYPNPFNPSTTISFQLAAQEQVSLSVFDVAGRRIRSLVSGEVLGAGPHTAVWNGRNDQGSPVASGVYYYRLQAGTFSETKAMVLLK